jgi:hypothetical protein
MNIKEKIKTGYENWNREALIFTAVFLLALFSFGLGWMIGSRNFTRPPIIVNCPPTLYETPQ